MMNQEEFCITLFKTECRYLETLKAIITVIMEDMTFLVLTLILTVSTSASN